MAAPPGWWPLMLALTPICVATNRDNTMDTTLVLTSLLAAWALMRAIERGNLAWLLAAFALVGIGFNIKTLEVAPVLPAFIIAYLIGAPHHIVRRVGYLLAALAVMVVIALAWILAVDMTPAAQRPFVGSTATNSEWDLTFGYNGVDRITGAGRGGNGGVSALRLLNNQFGSQISWLMAGAFLSVCASAWHLRPFAALRNGWQRLQARRVAGTTWGALITASMRKLMRGHADPQQTWFVVWGLWFLIGIVAFSGAAVLHTYYLVMLAPPLCALAGVGLAGLWADVQRGAWRGLLLIAPLIASLFLQRYILRDFPAWQDRLVDDSFNDFAVIIVLVPLTLVLRHTRLMLRIPTSILSVTALLSLITLLFIPTVWSFNSLAPGNSAQLPVAGPLAPPPPNPLHIPNVFGIVGANPIPDPQLIRFLMAHRGTARFLVATLNAGQGAPIILATGAPVMNMGGFGGNDPIITTDQLAQFVRDGSVRYFFITPRQNLTQNNPSLLRWIEASCRIVPLSAWNSDPTYAVRYVHHLWEQVLYDCG